MKKVVVKKGESYRFKWELESRDWVILTILMAIIDFTVYYILF